MSSHLIILDLTALSIDNAALHKVNECIFILRDIEAK